MQEKKYSKPGAKAENSKKEPRRLAKKTKYTGGDGNIHVSVPDEKPPHDLKQDENSIILSLRDRIGCLDAENKALSMAYEEELQKEPVPVSATKAKVLCGMVVKRIEDSSWGHKAIGVIGEGLVRELKEYAES